MTHAGNKPARSLPENFARLSDILVVLSQNESVEHVGFSVKETRRKRDTEAEFLRCLREKIRVPGMSKEMREGEREKERLWRQVRKESRDGRTGERSGRQLT